MSSKRKSLPTKVLDSYSDASEMLVEDAPPLVSTTAGDSDNSAGGSEFSYGGCDEGTVGMSPARNSLSPLSEAERGGMLASAARKSMDDVLKRLTSKMSHSTIDDAERAKRERESSKPPEGRTAPPSPPSSTVPSGVPPLGDQLASMSQLLSADPEALQSQEKRITEIIAQLQKLRDSIRQHQPQEPQHEKVASSLYNPHNPLTPPTPHAPPPLSPPSLALCHLFPPSVLPPSFLPSYLLIFLLFLCLSVPSSSCFPCLSLPLPLLISQHLVFRGLSSSAQLWASLFPRRQFLGRSAALGKQRQTDTPPLLLLLPQQTDSSPRLLPLDRHLPRASSSTDRHLPSPSPRRNTKRYRRVLKDDPPTAPDSPDRRIKMN
ncbi:hypothetical protein C7M84_009126 [Penaeus vannamei]|uniref:Uncharacterized protein n=1 Tax=Penaeus vannamei TaxID=6689 RepID=A0A423T7R1_PENVA|nr:hypothetical protein C7M84_009126 [Penaeus vannamei]